MGFLVLSRLAKKYAADHWTPYSFEAIYSEYRLGDNDVRLLKPLTMMNRSGLAVQAAVRDWQIPLHDLLIVCDDVNVPLGMLRLRAGGSAGGQHGLESCVEALGTEHVPRLRCGIGRTPLPNDLTDFVLSTFDRAERPQADAMIARAVEACEQWCTAGIEATMNRVNVS